MNNPTTLIDPTGLQGESSGTCGHGFQVPQGQNPAVWCYNHMGIGEGSSPGAFFTNTADEFDLMSVPVVVDTWVPPQQVAIDGTLPGGNIAVVDYYFEGYWTTTQVGNAYTLLQPGSFSIPASFSQTVQMFENVGVAPSPLDNKLNPFHGTDFNLRDFSPVCSAHVTLNVNSGQSPGQPTTGSMHFDAFNPTYDVPLYPLSSEGVQATELALHGLFDVAPYLLHIPGASGLCQ